MKEIGPDEIKRIQLDMLKDLHTFCMEHDINYSLAYGTLLGAVRHQGYIPWDDDVDLMMPRADYNRFLKTYGNKTYRIVDMSVNPDYGLSYAKVEDARTMMDENVEGGSAYGVYIDVFPVDNVPDGMSERKIFYRKKSVLNTLFNLKTVRVAKGRSLLKNLVLLMSHMLLSFVSRQYLAHRMSEMAIKFQGEKTSFMGIVAPADSRIEEVIPSCFFDEYIELPFEDVLVMSIKEYDKYLTAAYGDYMQLPPVEKRVTHHAFRAYWK